MGNYETDTLKLENNCTTYYARKQGKSHVANGTTCQDYCLVKNIDDETHIVCMADGHGGEDYTKSDSGSRIACEEFCNFVEKIKKNYPLLSKHSEDWMEILRTKEFKSLFIQSWKNAVLKDYKKDNKDNNENESIIIKKYGTTFLFVIYTKDKICIGQLGDGAILLFNNYNQCQLFKRHDIKVNSRTNSLASSRGKYAFIIDLYDSSMFSNILISTDGIYDKLDNDNSFLLYANSLMKQINKNQSVVRPFDVEDIDVSEISRDDCTVALLVSDKKTKKYDHPATICTYNIQFKRSLCGIEIYEAKKDGKDYEIHVVDSNVTELNLDMRRCQYLKAIERIEISDEQIAFVYEIPKKWRRINELIESEEHLEKRYWFNDMELLSCNDGEIKNSRYTNVYWLDIYEKMLGIQDEVALLRLSLFEYAFECIFVTEENKIVLLSDSFYQTKDVAKDSSFKRFFDYFSIIGKITCGTISVPLFECTSQGQNIVMLHAISERKPLCRVIFNKDKKLYGLWNATSSIWSLENGKRKEIPAQGVLRLNRNQDFYIYCNEQNTSKGAELVDGYAKYEINVFKENDK